MRALRSLGLGVAGAVVWPLYLVLLAYAARVAPWPRSLGILVSAVLSALAIALFVSDLLVWLVQPAGWAEQYLDLPRAVARQLSRAGRFLVLGALCFLLPVFLLGDNLVAPEGQPVLAPALGRILVLGFEILVWGTCLRLLRGGSALLEWISRLPAPESSSAPGGDAQELAEAGPLDGLRVEGGPPRRQSRLLVFLAWLGDHRRLVAWLMLAGIAAVIVLDMRGYSFTARRLAIGGSQTALVLALGCAAYHLIARTIDEHAWHWVRPNRSWARALKTAVVLRASRRPRGASPTEEAPAAAAGPVDPSDALQLDATAGLRRLCAYGMAASGLLAVAWIWDLNLALVRFVLAQPLWSLGTETPVTVGNLTQAVVVLLVGSLAWRYMSTLFAFTIFPRMPDDAGVRFAVVSLCRYAVMAVATLIALGSIHVDPAKIGVVLAALGVGLGFGLQEIVSNFVCGIILLLERPIRIGDVVTVAGTTGRVDRINIRATTIVNPDNQSMIVPNREFITGNLVNWTHKDRILRVPIKVNVAYGTDPDRVVDLLLSIARDDIGVLVSPAPVAILEGFGDSALIFALYAFVPDPSVVGRVRHRLCARIQQRFAEEGVTIPLPTRELRVSRIPEDLTAAMTTTRAEPLHGHRYDPANAPASTPHFQSAGQHPRGVVQRDQ